MIMKRRTAKIVAGVLLGVFLLFVLIAQVSGWDAIGYVGIAARVAMACVELTFDRCPHCQAYVGRTGGGYCPRCGKSLEEDA